MNKTAKILVSMSVALWLLSRGSPAFSQTNVTPMVIAATGSDTTIGNISLGSTIGELVTQTVSADSTIITQGYQQPRWLEVGIIEPDVGYDIQIFPNPSPGLVNVILGNQEFEVTVYDENGQIVVQAQKLTGSTHIDLTSLAVATYFLYLENSHRSYCSRLMKIQ